MKGWRKREERTKVSPGENRKQKKGVGGRGGEKGHQITGEGASM